MTTAGTKVTRCSVALLGLCAGAVASCGSSPSAGEGIDGMTLSLNMPAARFVVSDPAKASALFDATVALPLWPSSDGPVACPNDTGARYTMTFTSGTAVKATAVINVTGCGGISVSPDLGLHEATPRYYSLVAADTGCDLLGLASTGS